MMLAPLNNLHGMRFGNLTVIGYEPGTTTTKAQWVCVCDCGEIRKNPTNQLKSGRSKSCGCTKHERIGAKKRTHGHSLKTGCTRTYRIWTNMKTRCTNPKATQYAFYGGRGIGYCERWDSFELFLEDMGECPDGLTLDRKDVNGDYSKGNCVWTTWTQQARNRRGARTVDFMGRSMPLAEAAQIAGVSYGTAWERLRRGWDVDKALTA